MDQSTGPADMTLPADVATDRRPLSRGAARGIALAIFLPCLSVLLVAAWLTPNPAGFGTHTQLGLAECGFKLVTGLPCATCGMTTAFSHAARGNLVASFAVQPGGAVLSLLTAVATLLSGYSLATGASLIPLWNAVARPRTFLVLGGVILLAWAYTVLRTLT
jgi:hypothetical protein